MGFVGTSIIATAFFVLAAVLIALGLYCLTNDKTLKGATLLIFGTLSLFFGFIIVNDFKDTIREIETDYVQIDTVYTICNEKIDTTYIIHYR